MKHLTPSRIALSAAACTALYLSFVPSSARAQPFPILPGVSAATCAPGANGASLQPYVVGTVDIRDPMCLAPGLDQHWPAPMYHNEMPNPTNDPADEWTVSNLGHVFGLALDDKAEPNIYVTSSTSYGNGGGTGRVFRLDGTSGAISVFATLPNSGPGLGNIAYDRLNQQFFVSNFEDGKIYRLSATGTILDTFDPFAADDGTAGFAPTTERLWGLGIHNCRLYFGVWNEDFRQQGVPNTVWSIGLDVTGAIAGSATLEVTLANKPGHPNTYPVADISFSRTGNMLLAERGMRSDINPKPHHSRVLEFSGGHLAWVPSGNLFSIGSIGGTNAAGGVDYDCAERDQCNAGGHIVATSDALHLGPLDNIYGLQITGDTGGTVSTSYLIDLDNDLQYQDKTQIGDVEISRVCHAEPQCETEPPHQDCMRIKDEKIDCASDASGSTSAYTYTFTVTNNSGVPAHYLLLPGSVTSTNVVPLVPALPSGASTTLTVTLDNLAVGATQACFDIILADENFETCCAQRHCVELPDCACVRFDKVKTKCIPGAPGGEFWLQFDFTNLTPDPLAHVFLIPHAGFTASPDYYAIPPLAPGATHSSIGASVITGGTPGQQMCIDVSVHTPQQEQCCAEELCFVVPKPCEDNGHGDPDQGHADDSAGARPDAGALDDSPQDDVRPDAGTVDARPQSDLRPGSQDGLQDGVQDGPQDPGSHDQSGGCSAAGTAHGNTRLWVLLLAALLVRRRHRIRSDA